MTTRIVKREKDRTKFMPGILYAQPSEEYKTMVYITLTVCGPLDNKKTRIRMVQC